MKYIVLRYQLGSLGLVEYPIIFPNCLVHAQVAEAIRQQGMAPGRFVGAVSAGEINSMSLTPQCYGKSETLKVSSRGDIDDALIATMDYLHGYV